MAKKVLVIDDEQEVLDFISDLLSNHEFEVITALDGAKGLQDAIRLRPNLIILDIKMPNMDGFEFLSALRGQEGVSSTPVVMVTAVRDTKSILDADKLGAVDFLMKPFTPMELLSIVHRFI